MNSQEPTEINKWGIELRAKAYWNRCRRRVNEETQRESPAPPAVDKHPVSIGCQNWEKGHVASIKQKSQADSIGPT